jgi:hypothetical protein
MGNARITMNIAGRIFSLLLLGLGLPGGGCATAIERQAVVLEHKPLLIHLPGIAGNNFMERAYLSAITQGGFGAETRLYDWTRKRTWIDNLRAYDTNRATASQLAAEIVAFRKACPDRPVFLSSDSGGAGPLVWTLEALPSGVEVEGVVLLCPALSPDYDLSAALSHVRDRMVAFHSRGDGFVLSWGTRTYGTIDGKRVAAAGYGGFVLPREARDPAQYRKLKMVAYDNAWFDRYGNAGDHTGAMGVRFASGYIAPLLIEMALPTRPPPGEVEKQLFDPAATPGPTTGQADAVTRIPDTHDTNRSTP